MKSSLNRNLLIGFGVSIIILIISSVASLTSIVNLLGSAEKVKHSNLVAAETGDILLTMVDAETGQRGFLLTNDELFLEPFNGAYSRATGIMDSLKLLVKDNPEQFQNISNLDGMVKKRFFLLTQLINRKRSNETIELSSLRDGKAFMDSIRNIVKTTKIVENSLLMHRTETMNKFAASTPLFIVFAALLSLLITIVFYLKVKKEIIEKATLQQQLITKDININKRIDVIEALANKISEGNFAIRMQGDEKDNLGNLSISLNKMASSLQVFFNKLSDKEWLQTGIAQLNEKMMGDDNLENLTEKIMAFITPRSNSLVSAFYILDGENTLLYQNGFAINRATIKNKVTMGDGLIGQCAATKKRILITDINKAAIRITAATTELVPANIIVFPVIFEDSLKGVIEMGALHQYTERELLFIEQIAANIGISINTVQNRQRLQNLLEETQAQSEELMSQHAELEHMNVELEAQWQLLQSSEEELKVQQEELMETNTILEERSIMLEDRNSIVQQKNTEILQKVEELALSTKYKSEFLANMSHELRTPLNSILLLSKLLEDNNEKNLSEDQVKYAHVIKSSGNGLLDLIDEILDLSKIESGKMTVEFTDVNIDISTTAISQLFEPVANEKKLEWKIIIDTNVPEFLETDKLRLEQVLKNLLSNAFKFTQKGYVHLFIDCPVDKKGLIRFTVKDSGNGIAADKQKLIFEAFQQEDGSTRRKYGGTGLGLSISRELARLLSGEIILTSEVGAGSEFALYLPLQKNTGEPATITFLNVPPTKKIPDKNFLELQEEDSPHFTAASIPDEIEDDRYNIVAGDKTILIIEDDTPFAKALLDYTRQKGYKGLVAVRGDRGIEMANHFKLTGILLDIQLPVKNGWQVIKELKNNAATKFVPVHIMSSFQVKRESLNKGAANFINKPLAFEQLNTIFDKLEYVLGKKEKKVLIVEDNYKHAKALAYYLGTYNVNVVTKQTVEESIGSLQKKEVDCVILDMGMHDMDGYGMLEAIKQHEELKDIPIIIFTGKNLSQPEELKIKKYADTIVLKTAHSYQRILDEVSLFLHLVEEQKFNNSVNGAGNTLILENVLKDKAVLLADDDVRNIFAMTKALERHNMTVIPAMDGREALQLITSSSQAVDIILMDMMMPEMDGYETIKAIRSNTTTKDVPIIAVTAKAMTGDREKCIAAGASDYISKPVDIDQLVSLLRIWLYEKSY